VHNWAKTAMGYYLQKYPIQKFKQINIKNKKRSTL